MGLKQSSSLLKGIRHTAGVVLISALQKLFSRIQPLEVLTDGVSFTVTFFLDVPLPEGLLPEIEQQMVAIIRKHPHIESVETLANNVAEYFEDRQQTILADELRAQGPELIPVIRMGDLLFPCDTPHELDVSLIGAIKLLSIEHNSETGLSTICGTAFTDRKELKQFLKRSELAKTRDHCLLVQEMQLFGLHQGEWFWLPKGAIIRRELLRWWEMEVKQRHFQAVSYVTRDDFALAHARIYAATWHSYSDLPQRYCEVVKVEEPDIHLCGLLQTNVFHGDALSVFCRSDQVLFELQLLLELLVKTVQQFGLVYEIHVFGTHRWVLEALQQTGLEYMQIPSLSTNKTSVEFHIEDALGRVWVGPQLTLHQTLPKEQHLRFQAADGELRTPVQLSASLFTSIERFAALLIEHFAGALPLWLAPEQVRIIPLTERHIDYCEQVRNTVADHRLRVGTDLRRDTLSARVFAAENARIPYILVVGDQEEREGCVTVRDSCSGTVTHRVGLTEFIQQVQEESGQRKTTHKRKP